MSLHYVNLRCVYVCVYVTSINALILRLQCAFLLCVLYLRPHYESSMYVLNVCPQCASSMHVLLCVFSICAFSIFVLRVCPQCASLMCVLNVSHQCVSSMCVLNVCPGVSQCVSSKCVPDVRPQYAS